MTKENPIIISPDDNENFFIHSTDRKFASFAKELEKVGVGFFSYFEQISPSEVYVLVNKSNFLEGWIDRNMFMNYPFFTKLTNKTDWYVWDFLFEIPHFSHVENLFKEQNIEKGISYIENTGPVKKAYHFGFGSQSIFYQTIINNLYDLQDFIGYFKATYLKDAVRFRYTLDHSVTQFFQNESFSHNIIESVRTNIKSFHENESISKSKFLHFIDSFQLTKKESLCLKGVLKGMPNKEIAFNLVLSVRTVEEHLQNVKNKTGCRTKLDLILKYCGSSGALGSL